MSKKNAPKRINEEIAADSVQLMDTMEIVPFAQALARAKKAGMDLIEVKPGDPPGCVLKVKPKEKRRLTLAEMPTPLARSLQAYNEETQPLRKVHRLIDLIEVFVKFHTVAIVSAYFEWTGASDELKGLLGAGLRTPSLGIWWRFARDIGRALAEEESSRLTELTAAIRQKSPFVKQMDNDDNLIRFRNVYAHGATPDDEQCNADLEKYGKRLLELIEEADYLAELRLVAIKSDGNAVEARGMKETPCDTPAGIEKGHSALVLQDGSVLSLHPLLVYREESQCFFFYNDLRPREINLLNYDSSLHERDADLRSDLLTRYPLDEWSRRAPEEFVERVEQLTETFKGRREELATILASVAERNRGFLMVWGDPGIGKSAILARSAQLLQWPPELREAEGFEIERELREVRVYEYFIRRGQRTAVADFLLDNLNARIESHFRTGIAFGTNTGERSRSLDERLRKAASSLGETDRIVLFIDGLDEGVEAPGFLGALPREVPEKVIVIYASREHPSVRQHLYDQLDREAREQHTLAGLAKADIRALLHDCVDKYAIQEGYIDAILGQSEGNPLYLKLLCQGLEKGEYRLNDEAALPKEMKELYDGLVQRLSKQPDALKFLRLLAVGKDFFSAAMAAEVLELDRDHVEHEVLGACMEVLIENDFTQDLEDYQLFHESLREYLLTKYRDEAVRMRRRVTNWCRKYNDMDLSEESRLYSVRYLVRHLGDCQHDMRRQKRDEEAAALRDEIIITVENNDFRATAFRLCGNAISLQEDIRVAQDMLLRRDGKETSAEAFMGFMRMYHDEPRFLYEKQLDTIDEKGRSADWLDLQRYAAMGSSPRDRVLLVLRGLSKCSLVECLPKDLCDAVEGWLEEASESGLTELWEAMSDLQAAARSGLQ